MKLSGHFAVFNTWTPINSIREGRFLERVAPGALRRSMSEDRASIRALFEHGQDPQVGLKPLGKIEDLREDNRGAYYSVDLFDTTSYVRDVLPALEAGQYGASFPFEVRREEFIQRPRKSTYNPDGLAERTITEARVHEFGPVLFPAYREATASVRAAAMGLRPLASGRLEHVGCDLGMGPVPMTIRRLREAGKTDRRARELLRDLERGARVEIFWNEERTAGGHGFVRGRVLSGGISSLPLYGATRRWRLPSSSSPGSWRLGSPKPPAYVLP